MIVLKHSSKGYRKGINKMSVSLLEVIEAGGYSLSNIDDANWLLSKRDEFEGLIERVEDFLEEVDRVNDEAAEAEYRAEFLQEKADEERKALREDGQSV